MFAIGDGTLSCTEMPGFIENKGIFYVDCPGQNDSNCSKEYVNQTSIHMIQTKASQSIILFVFGGDQFTA